MKGVICSISTHTQERTAIVRKRVNACLL